MWVIVVSLLLGILIGQVIPFNIPLAWSKYFSVAVLAALDTGVGGIRASLQNQFSLAVFTSGFISNIIIATLLVYLGDRLGIDLYLAAIFVFGARLFDNTTAIRRIMLSRFWS